MLIFGHIGLSLGLGKVLGKTGTRIDMLLLGIGAIFPDVDKIISIIFGIGGRAFFHSFVFALALTLVVFASKKTYMKSFALGVWLHLLFDTIWTYPQTFMWPFLGTFNAETFDVHNTMSYFFAQPFIFVTEIAGFLIFAWFVYREKLYSLEKIKSAIGKKRLM